MNSVLAKSLYLWARGNPDNISLLETWRDAAILSIASGGGKEVVNTSLNGISVGFSSGQTTSEWFDTLIHALQYLEKAPVSKVIGVLR